MLRKNIAGQRLYFCLVSATDGAALTGATVTARRALDGGAQASATGSVTELGNGHYRFDASQADTNGDHVGYLFTATGAIPVSANLVTTAGNFADGAAFGLTRLDAAVTTRSSHSAADVWAVGSRTLTSFGTLIADIWGATSRTLTAFAFGVTVSTNSDKTGYSLAADQSGVTIGTVNSLATGALAAAAVASAACNKVADHVLRRAFGSARGSSDGDVVGFRSLLGAVAKLVNKISTTATAGKLTVFAEDDLTTLGTQTLSTDGTAAPIVQADTD